MNRLQKALSIQSDIKEGDAFNRELQVRVCPPAMHACAPLAPLISRDPWGYAGVCAWLQRQQLAMPFHCQPFTPLFYRECLPSAMRLFCAPVLVRPHGAAAALLSAWLLHERWPWHFTACPSHMFNTVMPTGAKAGECD